MRPKANYDVVVVGVGGAGSAVVAELASRGLRVLGIEQHGVAHDLGSSHGGSRVIRQAYFEDPAYVPLLLRAYERWRELELATGTQLLTETGGLMVGPRSSKTVTGSLASAEQWGLDHDLLDSAEVARRWSTLTLAPDDVALYEPRAGFVRPEAAVAAQVVLARELGADLRFNEVVTGWGSTPTGVEVSTSCVRYRAGHLVLAAGAWAPRGLAGLGLPLVVERHIQFWLRPKTCVERFRPDRQPVWILERTDGVQAYGFPALGSRGTA